MSEENAIQPDEGQEQESQQSGLLDSVSATDESQQETKPEETAVEHRADESIPEDEPMERPEWWPENFWKREPISGIVGCLSGRPEVYWRI